jgi:ABC-type multidrug transport system permease subunit
MLLFFFIIFNNKNTNNLNKIEKAFSFLNIYISLFLFICLFFVKKKKKKILF